MISDNSNWQEKPWQIYEYKDICAVIDGSDTILDLVSIDLSLSRVGPNSSGVSCTLVIAGLREREERGGNVYIADYNKIQELLTPGVILTVKVVYAYNGGKDTEIILHKGSIGNVLTEESSHGIRFRLTLRTLWDNLPNVPSRELSTVAASSGNKLLSKSRLLSNDKNVLRRTMNKLKMPPNGDCDVALAAATMIDNTETLFEKGDGPKVLKEAVLLDNSPKLRGRGNSNINLMLHIARMYSINAASMTSSELFTTIVDSFSMLLVPRLDKKTGIWKPAVIPYNMWDAPSIRLPLYALISKVGSISESKKNDVACVAVQYRARPRRGKDIELSGLAVCAEITENGKRVVKLMDNITPVELNKLKAIDKNTGQSVTTGSVLLRELPDWLEFSRSPDDGDDLPLEYKKLWAQIIARQAFSGLNRASNGLNLYLQPAQFDKVLNTVGRVIEVSSHNKDICGKGWEPENSKEATYGVVVGVRMIITLEQSGQFVSRLQMSLAAVRSGYEQAAMKIDSSEMFRWKGEKIS